jgi:hypothetical protein
MRPRPIFGSRRHRGMEPSAGPVPRVSYECTWSTRHEVPLEMSARSDSQKVAKSQPERERENETTATDRRPACSLRFPRCEHHPSGGSEDRKTIAPPCLAHAKPCSAGAVINCVRFALIPQLQRAAPSADLRATCSTGGSVMTIYCARHLPVTPSPQRISGFRASK